MFSGRRMLSIAIYGALKGGMYEVRTHPLIVVD